jgi:hypothetical protein
VGKRIVHQKIKAIGRQLINGINVTGHHQVQSLDLLGQVLGHLLTQILHSQSLQFHYVLLPRLDHQIQITGRNEQNRDKRYQKKDYQYLRTKFLLGLGHLLFLQFLLYILTSLAVRVKPPNLLKHTLKLK